jgi:hypothetical protein
MKTKTSHLEAFAPEMLEELEHLITDCIENVTQQYADGSEYIVERIYAYESTTKRIKELVLKAKGES